MKWCTLYLKTKKKKAEKIAIKRANLSKLVGHSTSEPIAATPLLRVPQAFSLVQSSTYNDKVRRLKVPMTPPASSQVHAIHRCVDRSTSLEVQTSNKSDKKAWHKRKHLPRRWFSNSFTISFSFLLLRSAMFSSQTNHVDYPEIQGLAQRCRNPLRSVHETNTRLISHLRLTWPEINFPRRTPSVRSEQIDSRVTLVYSETGRENIRK